MTHQSRRVSSYGLPSAQIIHARYADAEQSLETQIIESRLCSRHRTARSTVKAIFNGFVSHAINPKPARMWRIKLLQLKDKSEWPVLSESLPGRSDTQRRKRTDGNQDGNC
jgi:hypothetical protein